MTIIFLGQKVFSVSYGLNGNSSNPPLAGHVPGCYVLHECEITYNVIHHAARPGS
jgi:hypothetical protein